MIRDGRLFIGDWLSIGFHRTLRLPDDGKEYPLPAGLGLFPLTPDTGGPTGPGVSGYAATFLLPMYQREALWIGFDGASWHPDAVQVGAGGVDAISGGEWNEGLEAEPQNYLVAPSQPWLDGINVGAGRIRQFVAAPLGAGLTIESQVRGEDRVGGIQLAVYEAKAGRFPEEPPAPPEIGGVFASPMASAGGLGLGAGGLMHQKIYPDPHGLDTWDTDSAVRVFLSIVDSLRFRERTGSAPPPSPISAADYERLGIPWFDLYDEELGDVAAPDVLEGVRSVGELESGEPAGEEGIDIDESRVERLRPPGDGPAGGDGDRGG